nr:hypothetical protein [Thiobacillus sp. 0-1251]
MATSLDGFIARPDGNLDWLIGATDSTDDHGYADFMAGIDALVMGRNTFETALTFGEWPYPGRRVVVFSPVSQDIPLEHVRPRTYESRFVQSTYRVLGNPPAST